MNSFFQRLKDITSVLLSPELDYTAVRNSCTALYEIFTSVSAFEENAPEMQVHISTASGLAVSPYAAAFCITDMMRTRKFLQGIQEAVYAKLTENPGRPVKIFYAGCGPFATLLTPLTTVFSPAQMQLVLLDINPLSHEYLQKIIRGFALENYILGIEITDALQYTIPAKYKPDILVSETMKPGLAKEPQVSLISHLLPQCDSRTIVIPESITIDACLLGNSVNNPGVIYKLKTLMKFDAALAIQIKQNPRQLDVLTNGVTAIINERPSVMFSRLVLNTQINIYGDHQLDFYDSSLTLPVPVMDIAAIKKYPARLLFHYRIGDNPGFTAREL